MTSNSKLRNSVNCVLPRVYQHPTKCTVKKPFRVSTHTSIVFSHIFNIHPPPDSVDILLMVVRAFSF